MTGYWLSHIFLYILLFCSLIFLVSAAYLKQRRVKILFLILFSIFLSLGTAEFILSLITEQYVPPYEYRIENIKDSVLITSRGICFFGPSGGKHKKELKYEDIDNYDKNGSYIYNAVYNRYSNGLRYTKCSPQSEKTYIFLGCSMVFGEGLNDYETLPYYFSKLTDFKYNIINCGICGRSTNTAINILKSGFVDAYLKKSHIEYFVYSLIDDHLYRNFRISEPGDIWLYENGGRFEKTCPFRGITVLFKRSYLFRNTVLKIIDMHNKSFYAQYLVDSLKQMDKIIREKYKSNLIIVKWRSDSTLLDDKMREAGLKFILLPGYCEENGYTIKNDGHPSAKANEEIAEILYNKIN